MNLLRRISKAKNADERERATQKVVDDSNNTRRRASEELAEAYRKAGLALVDQRKDGG